jgi:hypothetical protein
LSIARYATCELIITLVVHVVITDLSNYGLSNIAHSELSQLPCIILATQSWLQRKTTLYG